MKYYDIIANRNIDPAFRPHLPDGIHTQRTVKCLILCDWKNKVLCFVIAKAY